MTPKLVIFAFVKNAPSPWKKKTFFEKNSFQPVFVVKVLKTVCKILFKVNEFRDILTILTYGFKNCYSEYNYW